MMGRPTDRLMRRIRALRADQRGMTVVEVVVAAMLLTIGSLAVLSLVGASARQNFRSEQSQVVSDRLQQEMERIKALADADYDQVALTSLPIDSTDTHSPAWRVSGVNYAVAQNGSQFRPLVYNGSSLYAGGTVSGGLVDPTPTHFSNGDVSGTIFRYVVWEDDPNCPAASCPGSQDMKRVIVAMLLDTTAVNGIRHYQELQAQIADPDAQPVDNTNPPPPGDTSGDDPLAKPWTYFLTDTTCNNSDRQAILGDHLLHNTNGICGTGLTDSSNCGVPGCPPGAPDLMVTHAPVFDPEAPIFDYATDVEPSQNPGLDKGIQMPKPGSNGCLSSLFQPLTNGVTGLLMNDGDATRSQNIHKWLSPPMGNGFNVALQQHGTLDLWTQSINAASYSGKICVWLFERHLNVLGVPVDTPAFNLDTGGTCTVTNTATCLTSTTYSQSTWPTSWTELHIPLHFYLNLNLSANSQLGLAIQVEKQGTSGGGMQFMYDEPSFDSRLELKSTSLLPF
jgi:type II secretory pathway pseudopilin PulG